jgi:iron complex outermembrane receptor protein
MVVTRAVLSDQVARVLSDVVKNDASMGEDYAPVGYYGDFEIRGFPIDLATGLQINGMTIAGEQDVPLENKERVEFVKGIAGVESGVASAGGLINYVTKEPYASDPGDRCGHGSSRKLHMARSIWAIFWHAKAGGRAAESGRPNDIKSYVQHGADGWRGMGAARH